MLVTYGFFQAGNRAPWGLYMHAAWFFGQPWHFEGYKLFIQVPIKKTTHFLVTPLMMKCCIRRSPRTRMSGSCRWRLASTTWRTPSPTSNSLQLVWHLHLHHLHLHHCHHDDHHDHPKARQAGLSHAATSRSRRGSTGRPRPNVETPDLASSLPISLWKISSQMEVLKSDGLDPT